MRGETENVQGGEATDVHHMAGRVGEKLLDTDTWLPCCRPCHLFIESHPVAARELGLSESRLTPVLKQ